MDELTQVTRLGEAIPAAVDLAGAERRLAGAISTESGAAGAYRERDVMRAGRRGAPGGSRRLAVTAVAAVAAVAVVATVVVLAGQGRPARPAVSGKTGTPARDTSPLAGTTPPAGTASGPAATGAELVAYATKAAAISPRFDPQPHEWIYLDFLQAGSSGSAGFLRGQADGRATLQTWRRVDGQKQASRFRGKLVLSPRPVQGVPAGWPSSSYSYLESLPTSPARLKAVIEANMKDAPPQLGIFDAINDLMENQVLPPRLNAGLYGVLATLPGVHYDPSVADFAGRRGVGFYTVEGGWEKTEIVINPRTYTYMGARWVAVRAHNMGGNIHLAKGHILGWDALIASGIVQHAGQTP